MCITFESVDDKMVRWGSWHWQNAGYGASLGFSSDGKMHHDHLATAACGGGNKVEHFEEMPEDIKQTDKQVSRLSREQLDLCRWLFIEMSSDSKKLRISHARTCFNKKYKKNKNYFRECYNALYNKLSALLDEPRINNYEWMRDKMLDFPARNV